MEIVTRMAVAARGLTRFVGRTAEMEVLGRALDEGGAGRDQKERSCRPTPYFESSCALVTSNKSSMSLRLLPGCYRKDGIPNVFQPRFSMGFRPLG